MKKLVQKKRKGFTLIEMVIVMFIISMLLLLIVPNLAGEKKSAEQKSDAAFTEMLRSKANMHDDDYNNESLVNFDEASFKKELSDNQRKRMEKLKLHYNNGEITSENVQQ